MATPGVSSSVLVHLTAWAPECADLRSNDDRIWRWMFDVDAQAVMFRTCRRLKRHPNTLTLRQNPDATETDNTEIWGRHPDSPDLVVLADIIGLSFAEIAEAHQALSSPANTKAA